MNRNLISAMICFSLTILLITIAIIIPSDTWMLRTLQVVLMLFALFISLILGVACLAVYSEEIKDEKLLKENRDHMDKMQNIEQEVIP